MRAPVSSFLATPNGPDGVLHLPQGKSVGPACGGGPLRPLFDSRPRSVGTGGAPHRDASPGSRRPGEVHLECAVALSDFRPWGSATGVAYKKKSEGPPPQAGGSAPSGVSKKMKQGHAPTHPHGSGGKGGTSFRFERRGGHEFRTSPCTAASSPAASSPDRRRAGRRQPQPRVAHPVEPRGACRGQVEPHS